MSLGGFLAVVANRLSRVQAFARAHRGVLMFAALGAFAAGTILSARALELDSARIDYWPLALLGLILAPLTLLHAAIGMQLLARCAGTLMDLPTGLRTSTLAVLADILPIPGGAIVRTGALVGAGGTLGNSALLVTGTAVLWISLAACGAGLAMQLDQLGAHRGIATVVLLVGLAGAGAVLAWIARIAGMRMMAFTLIHRLVGLGIIALRLQLSFAAVAYVASFATTMPFALTTIAATATSLAPGGLGISEVFAAVMATATVVPPAIALLAVALNRLVGFASAATVALLIEVGEHLRVRFSHA